MRVLRDRVLIERCEPEKKTAGGIVLPDNAQKKMKEGIVRVVGPGKTLESGAIREPQVRVGDRVFFGEYSGIKVDNPEGKDLLLVEEEEIYAIIEEA